jgi:hypothetical protein
MPTSELSDALNPYARYRQNVYEYSPQAQHILYQPVVQPVQQHVPHVSELEMAITEPVPIQQPVRSDSFLPRRYLFLNEWKDHVKMFKSLWV